MVKAVEVKNFKSLSNLKLDFGRINIFIGENGSGKSNILEAVAFGAAASANKLEKEFLTSRGIRVSEPQFMRSAFNKERLDKAIGIRFQFPEDLPYKRNAFILENTNNEFAKWIDKVRVNSNSFFDNFGDYLFNQSEAEPLSFFQEQDKEEVKTLLNSIKTDVEDLLKSNPTLFDKETFTKGLIAAIEHKYGANPIIDRYKIFAPENTFLRKFEDDEAGDPLGIKGQGLFRLLHYFQTNEDKSNFNQIKDALSVLDWFEDFSISTDLAPGERKLSIKDRFLDEGITISQNNANEGFLFILFYISLFVSKDAPQFFAIDNLDASFNPKLCKHITKTLVKLAKDNDKQALFTTHNPFILDGLDLTDDEQRLFVVYRNQEGSTVAKRIQANDRKMPMSQQWMSGFLGGLPENF